MMKLLLLLGQRIAEAFPGPPHPLKVTGYFEAKNTLKIAEFSPPAFLIYKNLNFAKTLVKNDQPSPQQWSEENTAAYGVTTTN